jgi:cytochrome b
MTNNNTSPTSPSTPASKTRKILVWDAPVRVFHWLLVLSFLGAYITAESERWRLLHVTLGYTLGGLVAFRILWGLMGTRYARFSSFIKGPSAVLAYLRSLKSPQPEHSVGHNPAGAVAIVLLLLSSVALVATGWAFYHEVGGEWLSEVHEVVGNLMLLLVGVHVAGVVVASLRHRENLVRAMVTGKKDGQPQQGIARAWWSLAGVMVLTVLGFWWLQWQSAPSGTDTAGTPTSTSPFKKAEHDGDDD